MTAAVGGAGELAARRQLLTEEVAAFIGQRAEPVLDVARRGGRGSSVADEAEEERFEQLALRVFAFQYEAIAPYRRLCQRLGATPERVASWRRIPAVPAEAFKTYRLFAGVEGDGVEGDGADVDGVEGDGADVDGVDVVRTFRSSGTTDPTRASQAHFSRGGLALMEAAVAANGRRVLFGDAARPRVLVLAPSPEQAPHMIMAHGMAQLMKRFGARGSRFLIGPTGLELDELWAELEGCQREGQPVALLGSSFGFVHLFDWMEQHGRTLALPEGSLLMDAGGYKGRSREIGREAFVRWAAARCGVPARRVVNLLGMTELASQIYDDVGDDVGDGDGDGDGRGAARMKRSPPWMRTEVVDPRRRDADGTVGVVELGQRGLLRHLDLANVERPMMIQSEDVGRSVARADGRRGFEILGRAKGAEPRGCSLSAEEHQGRAG